MIRYLLKLVFQTTYHLAFPLVWAAILGYKERMMMNTSRYKAIFNGILTSFIILFFVTFHTNYFPSAIAPFLAGFLAVKWCKPVYNYFYRMEKR